MKPKDDQELIFALKTTGEIYGKNISAPAAAMFLSDLEQYSADQIKIALTRCRKELKTFPSVADVVLRIDDGRPGPEEAWAMLPKSEAESVVWSDEMAAAWAVVSSIQSDPVAQRMAFKELYSRIVAENRAKNRPTKWTPSFGTNREMRQAAIEHAVNKGRLLPEHAARLGIEFSGDSPKLLGVDMAKLLQEMPSEASK